MINAQQSDERCAKYFETASHEKSYTGDMVSSVSVSKSSECQSLDFFYMQIDLPMF